MPRKKTTKKKVEPVIEYDETPVKSKKTKKQTKKKSSSSPATNIVMGIILVVLLVFIAFLYSSMTSMTDEMNSVKQTVETQNEDSASYLQTEVTRLKQELAKKEMKEFSGIYVNKVYGVEFEIPADPDRESGVIDNGEMIMFGPVKDFGDVKLPEYTLRIYEDEDIDIYKKRITFREELCTDDNGDCVMVDFESSDLAEERDDAVDMIFEERQINGLTVYYYLLDQDCLLPTMLVYNEENDTMYEFQQQCADEVDEGYAMLEKIVSKLVFD